MRFLCGLLTIVAAAVLVAACGGGDSDDNGSGAGSSDDPKAARAEVESVLRQWIDKDDCSLMSDRYAAEGFASAEEGVKACEEEGPGLRAGEYTIRNVEVRNRSAVATLAVEPGGERIYELVKGGAMGWEIDGVSRRFRGTVGDSFQYVDAYEINGEPVTVDAVLTVLSVKDRARPNVSKHLLAGIERRGRRWVRVRVRVKSDGRDSFDLSTSDFKLVDSNGQRYEPDFQAFEPALGQGTLNLSQGDRATGYIGFQVPDKAVVSEVRLAPIGGGEPFIWKVK